MRATSLHFPTFQNFLRLSSLQLYWIPKTLLRILHLNLYIIGKNEKYKISTISVLPLIEERERWKSNVTLSKPEKMTLFYIIKQDLHYCVWRVPSRARQRRVKTAPATICPPVITPHNIHQGAILLALFTYLFTLFKFICLE